MSNSSCPAPHHMPVDPQPLFSNGEIHFAAHDVGWIICAAMALIACLSSFWLVLKHLRFFFSPDQQRHIVRVLFMVPIYAISSFLAYFWWEYALYFQLFRDCYEAIVITSFYHLLLSYLSSPMPTPDNPCPQPYPTKEERQEALHATFADLHLKKWMWPMGFVKWRPAGGGPDEGIAFLGWMKLGLMQYTIVRPVSTLVAVISEASGMYCLASWSPRFLHLWVVLAISISVTIAMYALLQLYWPVRRQLAPYHPLMKLFAVKAVVFLTFWQESFLGVLDYAGVIKPTEYWSSHMIIIGISSLLSCFEMMCFGFMHISAFSYLPYRALAPLVPLDGLEPQDPDDASIEARRRSPSQWAAWEAQRDREIKAKSWLRPLPAQPAGDEPKVDKKGRPIAPDVFKYRKMDGKPLPRETKKLKALGKVLNFKLYFRDIVESTKFAVGGGKVLTVDRNRDLAAVRGSKRPAAWDATPHRQMEKDQEKEEREILFPVETPSSRQTFDVRHLTYDDDRLNYDEEWHAGAGFDYHKRAGWVGWDGDGRAKPFTTEAEGKPGWFASIKSRVFSRSTQGTGDTGPSFVQVPREDGDVPATTRVRTPPLQAYRAPSRPPLQAEAMHQQRPARREVSEFPEVLYAMPELSMSAVQPPHRHSISNTSPPRAVPSSSPPRPAPSGGTQAVHGWRQHVSPGPPTAPARPTAAARGALIAQAPTGAPPRERVTAATAYWDSLTHHRPVPHPHATGNYTEFQRPSRARLSAEAGRAPDVSPPGRAPMAAPVLPPIGGLDTARNGRGFIFETY